MSEIPPLACLFHKSDSRDNFEIAVGSLRCLASPLHPFPPLNFSFVMAVKFSGSHVLQSLISDRAVFPTQNSATSGRLEYSTQFCTQTVLSCMLSILNKCQTRGPYFHFVVDPENFVAKLAFYP